MRRCLLCLPLVLLGVAGFAADPAGAHGDDGTLEVVNTVPTPAGDEVTYTVELTYANDGEAVDGALVSATVRGPGAGAQEPIALASIGDGWYAGAVTFPGPGRWTVAFAAAEPVATLEVDHEVSATPTSTSPPTTTTSPDAGPALAPDPADIDDGPPTGLIVGAVVAGIVLIVAGVILVLRHRSLD